MKDDIFIDILNNVDAGLITMKIELQKEFVEGIHTYLEQSYLYPKENSPWNLMRKEVLRILHPGLLESDIIKEIKTELQEAAENAIIASAQ